MILPICMALLFSFLALIHLYWALGGRFGYVAAIPEVNHLPLFQPGPIACFLIMGCLSIATFLILMKGQLIPQLLPKNWVSYSIWGLAFLFFFRAVGDFRYVGFLKKIRNTKFAYLDSYLYSPLCLILSSGCMILQIRST